MPNFILRVIRPVERTAEYEYIKEFFRYIGCLVTDYAVDDAIPANWINALVPEENLNSIDIVMNCSKDPFAEQCHLQNIRRIYCQFNFNDLSGNVTTVPQPSARNEWKDKKALRQGFLRKLIDQLWIDDEFVKSEVQEIANVYLGNSVGEMFYFLQAKRNLRVLSMGEVLQDRNAQVTNIAFLPYVKKIVAALWEAYCRLDGISGLHGKYAQINAANKIYEIAEKLYDTERPRIRTICYDNIPCNPPAMDILLQNLHRLLDIAPQFVSAYLLMANIYRVSLWKVNAEEWCYQRIWRSIPESKKDYAFIWYRNAYFYEKRKKDLDKALKCYQYAVQLNPDCYQARFKLGYYAAADTRFDEAEALLRKTIHSIFHGRSTDPDENGTYDNWLALSPKESQYVYKCYILLAKIALNKNQEHAIKEYIGRACMAATRFDEATSVRQVSNYSDEDKDYEQSFIDYMLYHLYCTPVWAMWQVLSSWSEDVVRDGFVRNIVQEHLARWIRR